MRRALLLLVVAAASLVSQSRKQVDWRSIYGAPLISMTDFQWVRTPAVAYATSGAKTLTLAPVPGGVNGTNVRHRLYISDGANSEIVLITGGTAVSGAASGTIEFTTANTHNNTTWTIGTATCGGAESENSIPNGGEIVPPVGRCDFYAPWTITHSNIKIHGASGWRLADNRDTTGTQFVGHSTAWPIIRVGDIGVTNLQPIGFEMSGVVFTTPTFTVSGAANNGSGLIRLTVSTLPWEVVTGAKVYVSYVAGVTAANGYWTATVVDSTHIDLQGSTFSGSYSSGGVVAVSATSASAIDLSAYSAAAVHHVSFMNHYMAIRIGVGDNFHLSDYFVIGLTPTAIASGSAAIWWDTGGGASPTGNEHWINHGTVAPDQGIYSGNGGPCNLASTGFCPDQEPYSCLLIQSTGGFYVDGISCLRTGGGLAIIPNAGQGVYWPHIVNSMFDSGSGASLIQANGADSVIHGLSMVNVWFTNNNNVGIAFNQGSGGSLDGVNASHLRVLNNRQHGIYLIDGTNINIGSETEVCGNGLGSSNSYDGVLINGAVTNWSFQDSLSGACVGYSSVQRYGVNVNAAGAGWRITGNDLAGNLTAPINLGGTPSNAVIERNLGIDNVTPTVSSATYSGLNPVFLIEGATSVTTITYPWAGRILHPYTNGSGGVGTGGNISAAVAPGTNRGLTLRCNGSTCYPN